MDKKRQTAILLALLCSGLSPVANAACTVPGNAATSLKAGPVNPNNGFAEYLTDASGLSLELCLSPSQPTIDPATGKQISPVGTGPFCFFDPPDPTNPLSVQTGFNTEAFWWLAAPDTKNFPANVKAVMVLGAEAAFLSGVVEGGQFPFTRLRIRVDVPQVGFYRITEPYGQHIYPVNALGPGNEINDSFDVEFSPGSIDASGTITEAVDTSNCVGPWLTWYTFPNDPLLDNTGDGVADFIGDGATFHTVTGSPAGANYLRIEAFSDAALTVPIDLNGVNNHCSGDGTTSLGPDTACSLDAQCDLPAGSGIGVCDLNGLQTNRFQVVGKIYDGRLATPMAVDRVTYARNLAGGTAQVDVFGHGADTANATFVSGPNVNGPYALQSDNAGTFSGSQLLLPDADTLPTNVNIDATDGGAATPTDATHLVTTLTDQITITRAEYDLKTPPTLTVEAVSSDTRVPPTLQLVELDLPLAAGSVSVTEASPGVAIQPPGTVTVTSSAGGSDTRLVRVIDSSDGDNDGIADISDNCPLLANADQADTDSDGIGDVCDNCTLVANGTLLPAGKSALSQRDTNGNGYGNLCDGDIDTSGGPVGLSDYLAFRSVYRTPANSNPPLSENADFDGDGTVGLSDYLKFRSMYRKMPGPSCCAP